MFLKESDEKHRVAYVSIPVIFLSIILPFLLIYLFTPWLRLLGLTVYLAVYELFFWGMALAVLAAVLFLERKSLDSIGIRGLSRKEALLSLSIGIFMFLLGTVLCIFMERVIGVSTGSKRIVAALAHYPVWYRVLLAARAGFTEEILYRGYPIERINYLTRKTWPGALVSIMIHTILHIPDMGLGYAFGLVLPLTTLLAGLYIWKRNLTMNIVVHFLTDLLTMVLLPLLPFLFF